VADNKKAVSAAVICKTLKHEIIFRGGPGVPTGLGGSLCARSSRATPSRQNDKEEDNTVQCNEISSSEDTSPRSAAASDRAASPSAAGCSREEQPVSTSPLSEVASSLPSSSQQPLGRKIKTPTGVKARKSLSRELTALRMTATTPPPAATLLRRTASSSSAQISRRTRTATNSCSSDSENQDVPSSPSRSASLRKRRGGRRPESNSRDTVKLPHELPSAPSPLATVEQRVRALHLKLDSMEHKAAEATGSTPLRPAPLRQQQQLHTKSASKTSAAAAGVVRKNNPLSSSLSPGHSLRSGDSAMATPSRSLRPRTAAPTPAVSVKSSIGGVKRRRPLSEDGSAPAAAKSPRTVVVSQKSPVVNRSRQARVLRLKK
jgi:hypothetical protein